MLTAWVAGASRPAPVPLAIAIQPRAFQLGRSGSVVVGAQLALQLGVTDIDGRQPRPLTLETV
jgi:hypothetical protein